jgi:hypothetical protein
MLGILWTIFVVLLILWVLGFALHFAGGLIHILLVLAVIVLLYNLFFGRRAGSL